jgi:hypothetical protein
MALDERCGRSDVIGDPVHVHPERAACRLESILVEEHDGLLRWHIERPPRPLHAHRRPPLVSQENELLVERDAQHASERALPAPDDLPVRVDAEPRLTASDDHAGRVPGGTGSASQVLDADGERSWHGGSRGSGVGKVS